MAGVLHALLCQQGHTDGADHTIVWRDNDGLAKNLRERRSYCVVVSGAALEENNVPDLASSHYPVQIIQYNRIGQSGREITDSRTLQQQTGNIALHENGAAFPKPCRVL